MRDLTPVRLNHGGTVVVLTDNHGGEFAVPVTSLRETLGRAGTAPTGEPSPTGRKEPEMDSSLRPRDIQARIRAGESAEDVAAVAGTAVEKVMIFASPVLAERAHIAQSALTASVRRGSADSSAPAVATARTLGPATEARLRDQGVDPESVTWDSWRREDGRWTLEAVYHHAAGERRARFSFDQRGHFVHADDDEGRWLVGDGQVPARALDPVEAPASGSGLRLAPPYAEPARTEPVLGDDAIDLVTQPELPGVSADADWIVPDAPVAETPVPVVAEDEPVAEVDEPVAAPVTEKATLPTPRPRTAPPKKKSRASVPSWDEIMFGGGS